MTMDTSHSSRHYQLNSEVGIAEWSMLMPSGGHLVRQWGKNETQAYTLAMLHQLRCLDILRDDYVSRTPSRWRKHCLNYIRQTLLCFADTHLEYFNAPLWVLFPQKSRRET